VPRPDLSTSGLTLKLERVAARVKQREIAEAMHVSASRVAHVEQLAVVNGGLAARYRAALGTCRTGTSEAA
jgi:hypothetical protein